MWMAWLYTRSCSDETGRQLDSSLCDRKEAYFQEQLEAGYFLERNWFGCAVENQSDGPYTGGVQLDDRYEGHIADIKPLTNLVLEWKKKWLRIKEITRGYSYSVWTKCKAYRKQPVTFIGSKKLNESDYEKSSHS